jgi:hypothetical protein
MAGLPKLRELIELLSASLAIDKMAFQRSLLGLAELVGQQALQICDIRAEAVHIWNLSS